MFFSSPVFELMFVWIRCKKQQQQKQKTKTNKKQALIPLYSKIYHRDIFQLCGREGYIIPSLLFTLFLTFHFPVYTKVQLGHGILSNFHTLYNLSIDLRGRATETDRSKLPTADVLPKCPQSMELRAPPGVPRGRQDLNHQSFTFCLPWIGISRKLAWESQQALKLQNSEMSC